MKKIRILLSVSALFAFQAQAAIDSVDFTPSTVCEGTSTTFTSTSVVSGGVTITDWNWDLDGDGQFDDAFGPSINFQFNTPGTYNVGLQIITDAAETAGAYKLINVNPVPVADFSAPDVCEGTASLLTDQSTIDNSNGDVITSWEWDIDNDGLYDNAVGTSVTNDFMTASTYVVGLQVTSDKGCQSTTTENVTVDPMPTVSFTVAEVCLGNQTELNAVSTVSSGLITDYDWELNGNGFFDDASTAAITNQFSADGDYQVGLQVTSDQGCVNDTFQLVTIVPFPFVGFTFSNECQDTDIPFTNTTNNVVGSIGYAWSFGLQGTSTDESPNFTFTSAGEQEVELIGLTSFGCADTSTQTITIYPTPAADFTATEVCIGQTTNFTSTTDPKGSVIQNYVWDFADQNMGTGATPFHTYNQPDSFLVELIAYTTDGCRDTVENMVYVWPLPTPDITAGGPLQFCDGESVDLTVDPVGTPTLWSTGENTQTITVDTTGIYEVIIIDDKGCQGEDNISVLSWLLPDLTISNDTTVSLGEPVPLWVSGASFYDWVADTYLDDATSDMPISSPKESITYTVTGTDNNGCRSTIDVSIEVLVDYNLKPVNLFTPNGDGVNDRFYIGNIECYSDCQLKVYNRWGLEVYSTNSYINDWKGTFNEDPLPDGTYYYIIECDGREDRFDGAVTILR
ncbi:MAG: gliding motility-associated C-terminal domain-containing protein [Flavobacteriales bacterium]|nr:gliding motility-associated C-terminal domain-containing protein [Flavobacteriales bacterium]